MEKTIDCIVGGSCVLDIVVRPVPLDGGIKAGGLVRTDSPMVSPGGIVSNAGITLSRLGMRTTALSYIGNDEWGSVVRKRYEAEGLDTQYLITHPEDPTSTSIVLVDGKGDRCFLHRVGAPRLIDKRFFLDRLDLFAKSRMFLLGYYPLFPNLLEDLPEVCKAIRHKGCQIALDAAGDGGTLQPLEKLFPYLDIYVPSLKEASHQTGKAEPKDILSTYRKAGARGLIGIKLGAQGALLSPRENEWVSVDAISPPGPVVDTTGAGDCFYAGLLTGLLKGQSIAQAGQLAATTGAYSVTKTGGTAN